MHLEIWTKVPTYRAVDRYRGRDRYGTTYTVLYILDVRQTVCAAPRAWLSHQNQHFWGKVVGHFLIENLIIGLHRRSHSVSL